MNTYKIVTASTALAMMLSVLPVQAMTIPGASSTMAAQGTVMMGSRGDEVTALQTFLEGKGFLVIASGAGHGYFGKLTRAALMEYQTSVGIRATGHFGPLTRAAYRKDTAMTSDSSMHGSSVATIKESNTNTQVGVMVGGALMTPDLDIVDNAVQANNVTTVVAAVKAAGLVATLKGAGPFTVFAPSNTAFAKLPAGTVDTLLKPESLTTLKDILTYHVVAGRFTTAELYDGQVLTTVEGKTLKVHKVGAQVWINGSAMIETPNIISSNGVTHVIDTVLMPM